VGDPVQSLTDARYERVLALLEKGMGHKEIGTALQIKPRRLAEIIAELKVMYGVESLFQLGYRWREEKERRAHSVSQSSAAVS
jgi:DNA-binding NarL/FixJ family response regulator